MLTFLIIVAVSVVALLAARALDIECTQPQVRRGEVARPASAPVDMFAVTLVGLR
jgi:hypothetical protein